MGHLMMDSKGWPYDSFDCLSFKFTSVSGQVLFKFFSWSQFLVLVSVQIPVIDLLLTCLCLINTSKNSFIS